MGQRRRLSRGLFPPSTSGFIAGLLRKANRAKATVQVKVKVDKPPMNMRPRYARVNFPERGAPTQGKFCSTSLFPNSLVRRDRGAFVFVVKDKVGTAIERAGMRAVIFLSRPEGLSGGDPTGQRPERRRLPDGDAHQSVGSSKEVISDNIRRTACSARSDGINYHASRTPALCFNRAKAARGHPRP